MNILLKVCFVCDLLVYKVLGYAKQILTRHL